MRLWYVAETAPTTFLTRRERTWSALAAVMRHRLCMSAIRNETTNNTVSGNLGPTPMIAQFQRYRCRFSAENSDPIPIPPEFWG